MQVFRMAQVVFH